MNWTRIVWFYIWLFSFSLSLIFAYRFGEENGRKDGRKEIVREMRTVWKSTSTTSEYPKEFLEASQTFSNYESSADMKMDMIAGN